MRIIGYYVIHYFFLRSDLRQQLRVTVKYESHVRIKTTSVQAAGCHILVHKVFRPPISANLAQLRHRITAAVHELTPDMLLRVWQEIDFR
ncbi:hypothetical protein C0J52_04131 [Blattella germanica]|nr:hypothetical protein C0J52_04131 [Blattella germanica]